MEAEELEPDAMLDSTSTVAWVIYSEYKTNTFQNTRLCI